MNQENNILDNVLPSFTFSKKEYLQIFNINSLLTLNNFINTTSKISPTTIYRIFIYSMYEYQKNIINSPEITLNIITKVVEYTNQNGVSLTNQNSVSLTNQNNASKNKSTKEKIDMIYKIILSAKDLDDYKKIESIIEK
jgi:hypothetical protein